MLASNKKNNENNPAIIIRRGKNRIYCYEVEIVPGIYMVHRENAPLDCGARVYLTMEDGILPKIIVGDVTWQQKNSGKNVELEKKKD